MVVLLWRAAQRDFIERFLELLPADKIILEATEAIVEALTKMRSEFPTVAFLSPQDFDETTAAVEAAKVFLDDIRESSTADRPRPAQLVRLCQVRSVVRYSVHRWN